MTVPSEREFSYRATGVLVASVAGVSLAPSVLIFNTFTLFMQPMEAELAWSRTKISSLMTVLALAIALALAAAIATAAGLSAVVAMTMASVAIAVVALPTL